MAPFADIDVGGEGDMFGLTPSNPSPLFQYLQGFLPRKLKDSIRLCEFLVYNSPQISAALTKLSDYSITEVVYETQAAQTKEQLKELFEDQLRIKSTLKACSRDRLIYGNSFVSVYLPFLRLLPCKGCKSKKNIKKVSYKYKWKQQCFTWTCASCKMANSTHVDDLEDRALSTTRGINVIRFDPKLVDIEYNPITGQSLYYLTLPKDMKTKVQAGTKHMLNTMPIGFLKSIKEDRIFQFAEDQIFHMKIDAPAGIDQQWGLSPLIATMKHYFFLEVLRKAQEAIALEHMVPFRVLYPAQSSPNADPAMMINLNNWTEETKTNLKRWRRDPNSIMFSPIPVGVAQVGGDGKQMLVFSEIEAAENTIMAGLGVPREFIYGGMSFTGSSVTLRMLENQLLNQSKDLEDLMNWIGKKITKFLGWSNVKMSLMPFKLIDDVQQKQVLLQLNEAQPVLSNTTIANLFGYDLEQERKQRMQEAIDEAKFTAELQQKIQKMQNTLSSQARSKAQMGSGSGNMYDTQAVIAQADQVAQQVIQLDSGARRSQLHSLQSEDPVLYAVVVQRLEEYNKQNTQQAKEQAQQSGQQVQVPGGGK